MRTRPFDPRAAVQALAARHLHQRVVTRVELDKIAAMAEAIMGAQQRRVHIRQPRILLHGGAAEHATECVESLFVVARVLKSQRILQAEVAVEKVDVDQRPALVGDLVGIDHEGAFCSISMCAMLSSRYSSPATAKPRLS